MKKITLSLIASMAMAGTLMAGGDIAPVEEVVTEVVAPSYDDAGFYLGIAYGYSNIDATRTYDDGFLTITNEANLGNYSAVMLQAGYDYNKYVAVEGRYWIGLGETFADYSGNKFDLDVNTWGIYVKPQYPVTTDFTVYGLLGYANTGEDGAAIYNTGLDGFSWGLGAKYSFTDNVSLFVDYVDMYSDSEDLDAFNTVDVDIDSWNFGVSYKF